MSLKERILEFSLENPNKSYTEIAKSLGCSRSTVRFHLNATYRQNHIDKKRDRKKERKLELIKLAGSKCKKCGYKKCVEALEFHHLDPKEKDASIAYLVYLDIEKALQEIKKCVLLCCRCHREKHYEKTKTKSNG